MVRTVGEDKSEQKLLDDIAEFGWHCVHILAEGEHVEYSFTVGLFQSFRHPELIIFGLPAKVAHQILSIAAHEAKRGAPLDLSSTSDALLNGYSCCFAEVPISEYSDHVGFSRWYYQGNEFPLYQIIWPSRSGLFPWHPDAAEQFKIAQPVIAMAPRVGPN
ncbi:hypothetical protein GCM10011521_28320 [Arenimonas soli]|uniref:DUF4262 domain-containing protein n=1 Tax=Arenimonas soli TaxID=2269504 RepID=A0ABQ1HUR1_9GAMM|nr:DUF4262 domain-containing protein [Arenimonas soli]GGA88289.1 hypothetical protein GCM10011521_28320 [Arenimonas soli]